MSLEQMLANLPPVIHRKKETAWLTIGAGDNGKWLAGYLDSEGYPVGGLQGSGNTPIEALRDLQSTIRLASMYNRPAVKVDETTGQMLPPLEA